MLLAFVLACLVLVQARNDVTWVPGAMEAAEPKGHE